MHAINVAMVNAIKELKAQNEALHDRLAMTQDVKGLKAQNEALRDELAMMARDVKGLKAHTGYGVSKGSFLSLIALMGVFALMGSFAATIVMRRHG